MINKTPQNIKLKILRKAGYLLPASLHEDEMSDGYLSVPETCLCRLCPELHERLSFQLLFLQKDKKKQEQLKETGGEGDMVPIHVAIWR